MLRIINKTTTEKNWFKLTVLILVGYLVCFGLYAYSVFSLRQIDYFYLIINLFLATIPLILAWRLTHVLTVKRWSSWEALLTTFVWIIFLPNSFYMISDYIHLDAMAGSVILYNSVMFTAFIYLAVFMGMVSLYLIHQQLKKRLYSYTAMSLILVLILGCCTAIYLGRDLRWNSWDVVLHPAGLLFDISNLILRPQAYPLMIKTVLSFFVLLASAYWLTWRLAKIVWLQGVVDLTKHLKKRTST